MPKGSNILEIQKYFINKYLKSFYQKCTDNGIEVLAFFGNDDLYPRKKYFKKYTSLLDEKPFQKEDFNFKAYGYVPDYKFGLKTGCKLDAPGWTCPEAYTQEPVDFTDKGRVVIQDVKEYFLSKGSIQEDLANLTCDNKTIMAFHCPPANLELDVCRPMIKIGNEYRWAPEDRIKRVGSSAIYKWIEKNQPPLALCGHIHESYKVTNVWKASIGNSLVIQPGQCFINEDLVRAVLIKLSEDTIETELLEIEAKGVQDELLRQNLKSFIGLEKLRL